MSDNKSYRIRTNISQDSVLNVNLNQDFDTLEILSLKIGSDNVYKFHTSNYGCIAGRVLANGGFGIPNAKISVFIEATEEDISDNIISYLYPYKSVSSKNEDGIRYNLLPEDKLSGCHQNVGTFPSKRLMLDDNNVFEVYDKYYKFTTRSNEAGDYMIFGVPTGNQTLHVDIDLSDIGILSQRPRDMIYKGYDITQFENANMFKKDVNLDNLTQIITQNSNVYVYPFWGESSEGEIAISRKDIEIQYKFEPTCVFMGSIISDESSNGISKRCIPSERMGKMDKLTTGKGTIEMIRDTGRIDNEGNSIIEDFVIQGNQLIDGNGVWCYQIPMNLDYVKTDEYGNIVPTDDPEKGVPTRTRVRFRMGLTDFDSDNQYSHLTKILVPNNPQTFEEVDYVFGTKTESNSFKDLFWNNVYTVKSYIPRFQMGNLDRNKRFSGIKAVNVNNTNNPVPYNNMRVDLTFMFTLQCAVFKLLLWITGTVNKFLKVLFDSTACSDRKAICIYIGDGYCSTLEGWYFAPKCENADHSKLFDNTLTSITDKEDVVTDTKSIDYANQNTDTTEKICLTRQIDYFVQCVELTFAQEYDVIQFDFYNDWLNGVIYSPRWFADIRPKRSYLFGLIRINSRINACMENTFNLFTRRYTQQCAMSYGYNSSTDTFTDIKNNNGCAKEGSSLQKCHKSQGRKWVKIFRDTTGGGGIVHEQPTMQQKNVYYLRPCEWIRNNGQDENVKCNLFATDIVLLGSLDENNSQGIPQSFKKLVSSSFQMPDPLASTNMGIEGYLYGLEGEGSKCSNSGDEKVETKTSSFKNLVKWTEDKDYYEPNPYDNDEYAVTESAGIDWGFVGPNQKTGATNDIESLYFPGGHFLGVSCFNSQVNIKSCVNLSRVCEIGTLFSQRQVIRKYNTKEDTYSYLVPTGLISRDEINDGGFRNEFATMNYNGLRVKSSSESNIMKEYDFETINPINFNGELNDKISGRTEYNSNIGFKDDESGSVTGNTAYRRTIEENSKDYYRFRLGLHADGKVAARKKYLSASNDIVSLPQYENSFYFYFGLKNGSTALDRFNNEYFAECPSLNIFTPSVKIVSIENATTPCSNDGEVILQSNIEDIQLQLIKNGIDVTEQYIADKLSFKNLPIGKYTLYIKGYGIENIQKIFEIGYKVLNFTLNIQDFTEEHHYTKENFSIKGDVDVNTTGYFSISGINTTGMDKLYIQSKSDLNTHTLYGEQSIYDIQYKEGISGNINKCYVWSGNTEYTLYAMYPCGQRIFNLGTFTVKMPTDINILLGGKSSCSYKKMIKPLIDNNPNEIDYILDKWFEILLGDNERGIDKTGVELSEQDLIELKKSLFWTKSIGTFYDDSGLPKTGSIPYRITGSGAYTEYLFGSGEKIDTNTIYISDPGTKEEVIKNGYALELSTFYAPTEGVPSKDLTDYYFGYSKTNNKINFKYSVKDNMSMAPLNNKKLTLPSIYRPFFIQATFVRVNAKSCKCHFAIVNGITKNNSFNHIGINDMHLILTPITRETKDYGKHINDPNVNDIEKNYATATGFVAGVDINFYGMAFSDDAGNAIYEKYYNVNFLGDKNSIGKYYPYDSKIKYYGITSEQAEIIQNRTTPYYCEDGKNFVSYIKPTYEKNGLIYYNWTQNIWENLLSPYFISKQNMIDDNYNYEYIVGVFDSYYVDNDKCSREITTVSPRHINHITVFNVYTRQEFRDAVKAVIK